MNPDGVWRLSPAFDMVWAFNPSGRWTDRHQMSVNGKRSDFKRSDLESPAEEYDIRGAANIREEVADAVAMWPKFARRAGVDVRMSEAIRATHLSAIVQAV
jgi:serine/threonine-protein kinase HipA